MKKSTIMAGAAGAIVMFLLGWAFYGTGFMDSHMTEAGKAMSKGDDANIPMIFVGHLISCIVLAMIYSKWARGTHGFGHGFQLGALVGVFIGVGMNLVWMATGDFMSSTGHIMDGVFQIVGWGLVCGVIAIVYDKTEEG